jgi:lipopolysaccharide biosynthesis protein
VTRIALHLHAYYIDMLPDIVKRLELNAVRPDLFVSVADASGVADARRILTGYSGNIVEIKVVPNRGRDIGPLLTAFGPQLVDGYEFVGHLHTKKTADVKDETVGTRWHEFLLENLLGGRARMADILLGRMVADPSIGMAFPDDPNVIGWGNNLSYARKLGERLGLRDFPEHFVFPIGTMFWARVESVRPMLELQLDWHDYPAEPVPYDGSVLHAIERMFPFVVEAGGARCVLTNVSGVTR